MPVNLASLNSARLRIDTKAIRVIGNVQVMEFMPESINLQYECT